MELQKYKKKSIFAAVNKYDYLSKENLDRFIAQALQEDVGDGDHSALACIPAEAQNQARLMIKDEGTLAGIAMAQHIFTFVDSSLVCEVYLQDGQKVKKGDIGLVVKGNAQSILKAERLVLNCMQRMSGIATHTSQLKEKIAHTKAKLLDTRKTTPNFRIAEKWAVKIGGGQNHRFGLFDMIMLKDNHIAYAGGITQAIAATRKYLERTGRQIMVEVETQNLAEVEEVLKVGGVDVVMLDNMSIDTMKEAVALIKNRFLIEASGGITEDTIAAVAETGVDYISVGALTHTFRSLDISLKAF